MLIVEIEDEELRKITTMWVEGQVQIVAHHEGRITIREGQVK